MAVLLRWTQTYWGGTAKATCSVRPTWRRSVHRSRSDSSRTAFTSAYRKPAFQPSAFRRLFIGFQPSAENQPVSMNKWKKGTMDKLLDLAMKFFYQSENVWKIFFAWNVLKHKVKPKNSRNSTFFKKLKFPPHFWKTLVKFPWKSADFRLMAESR